MGGAGVDPPSCKTGTFFLRYFCKFFSKFETSPFSFICLEISINWHTKSQRPKKNLPIFQEGGSTPVPPTHPVIRVVLLHTEQIVQRFLGSTVLHAHGIQMLIALAVKKTKIYTLNLRVRLKCIIILWGIVYE